MQLTRVPASQRRDALARVTAGSGLPVGPSTTLVEFSVMVRDPRRPSPQPTWRTFRALMDTPTHLRDSQVYLENSIRAELSTNFVSFAEYDGDDLPVLHCDADTQQPVVVVHGQRYGLNEDDLFEAIGRGSQRERKEVLQRRQNYYATKKCFGYIEDVLQMKHRSFRYHVRGADVPTLQMLLPNQMECYGGSMNQDCDRMCMYTMLRQRNAPRPQSRNYFTDFEPRVVHQWLHNNGWAVGAITDGLTPEHIQAHAEAHRYPHAALDLTRSIVLLHIPDKPRLDLKTIAYTVVGDHAIPFTDPDVIKSIMQSASNRLGQRRISSYAFHKLAKDSSSTSPSKTVRKRKNSVDRVFLADRSNRNGQREDGWRDDAPLNVEVEDREEEFEDTGSQCSVTTGASSVGSSKRTKQYPLAHMDDRFRCFTKENDQDFIRAHLRPDYQEGTNPLLWYYFVCTDQPNIEFLYDYCLHVLVWNPTTCARTYNGLCTTLTIGNVVWTAQPDIAHLRRIHSLFHPKEPFRLCGMATYAYRMLYRELSKIGRYGGTSIWDCMSQYPPNLRRLLDNHHPYNRPKLLQRTYHPPYGALENHKDTDPPVLIPMEERRRVDLIRSYTACLLQIADDRDEFPIHDITNMVVPFDMGFHGHLPVGHYLVDIPTQAQREARGIYEEWQRWPCFAPDGEPRMMSHRLLKALVDRKLLTLSDVRLACVTNPQRQKKFGTALVAGFVNVIHSIYRHPELQSPDEPCAKKLINQLVGLCNGTTLPHSGNRFAFKDVEELYQLMLRVYSEDQMQRLTIERTCGVDVYWNKTPYTHYEVTTSGLTYRHYHMQPVYTMVLETQALRIYDLMRPIPLYALIQVNIDAVEYRVKVQDRYAPWARDLESNAVSVETYKESPNQKLLDDRYLGRYKPEAPKPPHKWTAYYHDYQVVRQDTKIRRWMHPNDWSDTSMVLQDPECRDWVSDWKSQLRVLQPETQVVDPNYIDTFCLEWYKTSDTDRSGILLTGPAGTGKTHFVRNLEAVGRRLGLVVVRTAFTHAACVQLGPDAVTLSSLFGLDHRNDHRSIMVMSQRFAAQLRNLRIDVLIIDEISMIPLDILECLLMFHHVASQTRLVLSGDFHQLPPVEPEFDRPEDYNYFEYTDIFPYLLYDRLRNTPGQWIQLTECMRTNDPLLQQICKNPLYVVSPEFNPGDFPVRPQQPIWRFLCHTNRTRKACNWYCMVRWLEAHPDAVSHPFRLGAIYAQEQMRSSRRFDAAHWEKEFNERMAGFRRNARFAAMKEANNDDGSKQTTKKWTPKHWDYLQNFTYAVGMEVVSRNTLRDARCKGQEPRVVNNRRAVIESIDVETGRVALQWLDVLQRAADLRRARQDPDDDDHPSPDELDDVDEEPLLLTFFDFAFNFVPGFCVTAHLAQGETIRQHYGILDWNEIKAKPQMAYVAVTRASHPEFLHIVSNYFTDPWDSRTNHDVALNVLKKLYHFLKTDFEENLPWHLVPPDLYTHWKKAILDIHNDSQNPPTCTQCKTPIRLRGYMDRDTDQFKLLLQKKPPTPTTLLQQEDTVPMETNDDLFNPPDITSSSSTKEECLALFTLVCDNCHADILCKDKVYPGDVKKTPVTKRPRPYVPASSVQ